MKIKSACIASVALFTLLIPVTTLAVSPQVISASTTDELVLQIKALQAQVVQLTAELAATKKEVAIIKEELRITKTLKFGMADDEVKKLQEFLSTMPDIYPEGLVTGYFGPLTERAVKKWQEGNGIEGVGIVGPKTRAKLSAVTAGNQSLPPIDSNAGGDGADNTGTSTLSGPESRAENHPTTTPSGAVPATPAIPAEPVGQTSTTTESATPAVPATPVSASTPPATPPVTQYTITVTQGTNGTISPGTTSVTSGGSLTFTITPLSGYQIENLIVDGANITATGTYSFMNVTVAHTLSAVFVATPPPVADKSPRVLISAPDAQFGPKTSGNRIIYLDNSSGILLGDLLGGPTITLTTAIYDGYDIDGDYAVFMDTGPSGTRNVFLYKISTGEKSRINDSNSSQPAIHGDRVVWLDMTGGTKLVAYQISAGLTTVITDSGYSPDVPDIYGDKIVWTDTRTMINNPNNDIYLYDFQTATTTQVTTAPCQQESPKIWENVVAWTDKRNADCSGVYNGNADVFYRDLSGGPEEQVTTSSNTEGVAAIVGSTIAYINFHSTAGDVYLYDTTSGIMTQVTNDGATQSQAHLSPTWLTWVDYRGSSPDIWGKPI